MGLGDRSRTIALQTMTETVREQALYLPSTILDALLAEAARRERSVSWCLQRAWTLARDRIRALVPEKPPAEPGVRRKQTVLLPEVMLHEIEAEAARLEVSLSFVVCRAWRIAAPELDG
jgi:uncharacterized small protein (TIGR04563 family)